MWFQKKFIHELHELARKLIVDIICNLELAN